MSRGGAPVPTTVRPLMEVLQEVPDVRGRHGRRHPLAAILGMACAAMLCGYRSYSAIAEWGRHDDAALVEALGFTHQPTPCAATLFHAFRRLDRADLEARLGAWAAAVLAAAAAATDLEAVALDGKTPRHAGAASRAHRASTCSRPSATGWG